MRSMVPFPTGHEDVPAVCCARRATTAPTTPRKITTSPSRARSGTTLPRPATGRIGSRASRSSPSSTRLKSHESQIRTRPHKQVHDPAKVRVPAYHPDTPEVRQDWAQYYDIITEADADAGVRLKELEKDGPCRRHHRLLLGRPRLRHAAQQTLAVRLRPARAVGRLHPREMAGAGAEGLRARRQVGTARELRRLRADRPQPGRHRAARDDAGPRVPGQVHDGAAAVHLRLPRPDG